MYIQFIYTYARDVIELGAGFFLFQMKSILRSLLLPDAEAVERKFMEERVKQA